MAGTGSPTTSCACATTRPSARMLLTFITDSMGFFIFLGLATLVLL